MTSWYLITIFVKKEKKKRTNVVARAMPFIPAIGLKLRSVWCSVLGFQVTHGGGAAFETVATASQPGGSEYCGFSNVATQSFATTQFGYCNSPDSSAVRLIRATAQ